MSRQRNALALVGLLAAAALATENIVVGGDGSGATLAGGGRSRTGH